MWRIINALITKGICCVAFEQKLSDIKAAGLHKRRVRSAAGRDEAHGLFINGLPLKSSTVTLFFFWLPVVMLQSCVRACVVMQNSASCYDFRSLAVGKAAASVRSHLAHTPRWASAFTLNSYINAERRPWRQQITPVFLPDPVCLLCCHALTKKTVWSPERLKTVHQRCIKMTNYAFRACINTAVTLSNPLIMYLFIFRVQFHPHSKQPNCTQVENSLETRCLWNRRAHADASRNIQHQTRALKLSHILKNTYTHIYFLNNLTNSYPNCPN